ncbi:hypothetical protein TNIN_347101 [Trichonephila inaurata madagascariensis]|uniref:Uncharacterized protein n=1 Tax=Trichonephila inaurata madagascariensis TaxID=2747483 RepID=A0A8X6YGZ1_9ARAC|nr:hypothetical protein TNIN_478891 [Trichonephila inaurata madagascariensis]GFY72764.1 hypothetical protein TNIN_347101 [Trichonephila inaurata madagascariensis]
MVLADRQLLSGSCQDAISLRCLSRGEKDGVPSLSPFTKVLSAVLLIDRDKVEIDADTATPYRLHAFFETI